MGLFVFHKLKVTSIEFVRDHGNLCWSSCYYSKIILQPELINTIYIFWGIDSLPIFSFLNFFMRISFHGAARTVTGSKHLLHIAPDKQVLLDCGMFQGMGKQTLELNSQWGFDP